ncbi:MAG: PEP-CTERM sorting domain-containing protein [Gallionellaceae bacterium]|nr:PEP-CTERM sorting domain-containing protein [Gallionellaceae bacterium]
MKLIKLTLFLIGFVASFSANATLIDFEGTPDALLINGYIDIGDYRVTHSGFAAYITISLGAGFSGNGTQRLISLNASTITISDITGDSFDFLGFDGAESWGFFPDKIAVTGIGAAGTVQALFDLDLIKDPLNGFQHFDVSGFSNITQLIFAGVCNTNCNPVFLDFSIDNLQLAKASVPEPNSIGLLAIGALGAAFSRRRLKS